MQHFTKSFQNKTKIEWTKTSVKWPLTIAVLLIYSNFKSAVRRNPLLQRKSCGFTAIDQIIKLLKVIVVQRFDNQLIMFFKE